MAKYSNPWDEWEASKQSLLNSERQKSKDTRSNFTRGLLSGVDSLQGMGYGAAALAGDLVGAESVRDWGVKGYERNMEEASLNPPDVSFGDISGAEDTLDWASYTLGSLIPSIAEAGVGAVAGSMAAPGPGTVAGGVVGRTILKKSIGKMAGDLMEKGVSREIAQNVATRQMLKSLGAKAGAVGATAQMESGGNFGESVERFEDEANPYTSLAFGTGAAFLELAGGNVRAIDKILGTQAGRVFSDAVKKGDKNFASRMMLEAARQSPAEAAQEFGQKLLSLANIAAQDKEFEIFAPENVAQLKESAAAGALGGLAFGAGTALTRGPQPPSEPPKPTLTDARREAEAEGGDALDQAAASAGVQAQEISTLGEQQPSGLLQLDAPTTQRPALPEPDTIFAGGVIPQVSPQGYDPRGSQDEGQRGTERMQAPVFEAEEVERPQVPQLEAPVEDVEARELINIDRRLRNLESFTRGRRVSEQMQRNMDRLRARKAELEQSQPSGVEQGVEQQPAPTQQPMDVGLSRPAQSQRSESVQNSPQAQAVAEVITRRRNAQAFTVTDPQAKMDGYVFVNGGRKNDKWQIVGPDGKTRQASKTLVDRMQRAQAQGQVADYVPAESTNVPGGRKQTPEGARLLQEAQQQARDAVNNPDLTGKQRADTIANLRNLVNFRESTASNPDAVETGYFKGDPIAYTGVTTEDGLREFIYLEGSKAGAYGHDVGRQARDQRAKDNQREWQEQQEGFKRLRQQTETPADLPRADTDTAPSEQAGPADTEAEGFDSKAWDAARDETIKASREAGNVHLDSVPPYVETMRGKKVFSVHDPKVRGVVRTVDNRGNVYVDWGDAYSAEKEMASPSKEGKKTVYRTSLGKGDLKDYVVASGRQQSAATQQPTDAELSRPAQGKRSEPAQELKGRTEAQRRNDERLRRERNTVDPEQDDIIRAISKLGGLDMAQAQSEWGKTITDASKELRKRQVFGKPVLRRKNGRTLDGMVEALRQYDYLQPDADGNYTINGLFEALDAALRGQDVRSEQAQYDENIYEEAPQQPDVDEYFAFDDAELAEDGYNDLSDTAREAYETLAEQMDADFLERLAIESEGLSDAEYYQKAIPLLQERLGQVQQAAAAGAGTSVEGSRQDGSQSGPQSDRGQVLTEQTEAGEQTKMFATPPTFGKRPQGQNATLDDMALYSEPLERAENARQGDMFDSAPNVEEQPTETAGNDSPESVVLTDSEAKEGRRLERQKKAAMARGDGDTVDAIEEKMEARKQRIDQRVARESKQTQKAESTDTKIEDFGEKIGGARKDLSAGKGKSSRPKARENTGWRSRYRISQIENETVRKGSEYVDSPRNGKWAVYDNRKKSSSPWGNMPRPVGNQLFDSKQEAEEMLPALAVAEKHSVYTDGKDKHTIYRKVGNRKRVRVVAESFDTREDALRYMAQNAEDILTTKLNFGEEILPKPDTVSRIGDVRRIGDVSGSDFMDAFGFRGVEFGNWVSKTEERQEVMNHAYDALLDMAEILNIPPKAVSLNGDLALAFGARGQGLSGAAAHYEPSYAVINLTKMAGAGHLAHEWFHALDHYVGRLDTKAGSEKTKNDRGDTVYPDQSPRETFATHGFQYESRTKARKEIRDAFSSFVKTMWTKGEKYVEDTRRVEDFLGKSRDELANKLKDIREHLSKQLDPKYYKRNNKPATQEQLARFDQLAEMLINGESLSTEYRIDEKKKTSRHRLSFKGRNTNDILEELSGIYKAVRGRTGFSESGDNTIGRLVYPMRAYQERIRMLKDAENKTEKTRSIPTNYRMQAKAADQGRSTDYWATEHELAARAFAAYLEDNLAAKKAENDFLVYQAHGAVLAPVYPEGLFLPYPEGSERTAINKELENLFSQFKTKETDQGVALYSRTTPTQGSATLAEISTHIDALTGKWKNAPTISVVQSEADLPAATRRDIEEVNAQGQVRGVFHRGTAYLVADNIATIEQAEEALLHEAIGHYGVKQMFGKDFTTEVNKLFISLGGEKGVKKVAGKYGIDLTDYLDNAGHLSPDARNSLMVEELLAHLAGNNVKPNIVQRVIASLRDALRRMGFERIAGYGDADLLRVLDQARHVVEKGPARVVAQMPDIPEHIMRMMTGSDMARVDQTQTKAFKDWFGDSKVVDEDGAPMVVYHGTTADFGTFDLARAGEVGERFADAAFFTDSPEVAGGYAAPWMGSDEFRSARSAEDAALMEWGHAALDYGPKSAQALAAREKVDQLAAKRRDAGDRVERFEVPSEGSNIVPAYLSMENPLEVDAKGKFWFETHPDAFERAVSGGHDGLIIRNVIDSANTETRQPSDVYAVFSPTQIKSATGNRGTFDPGNADIRYSRSRPRGGVGPAPSVREKLSPKVKDATDYLRMKWQDKFTPVRRAQDEFEKLGWVKTEENDAYLAEERFHGKAATRLDNFHDEKIKPLTARMKELNLDVQEVEDYLYAKFAPERNAHVARVNKKMPYAGSGMFATRAEKQKALEEGFNHLKDLRVAEDVLAELSPKMDALQQIEPMVRDITQTQRDIIRNDGLEGEEIVDAWELSSQNYIPLKGGKQERPSVGQGFGVKGSGTKRALGRSTEAENILAHLFGQVGDTIVRAEKVKVSRAFLRMVEENPSDAWEIHETIPTRRTMAKNAELTAARKKLGELKRQLKVADSANKSAIYARIAELEQAIPQMPEMSVREIADFNFTQSENVVPITREDGSVVYVEIAEDAKFGGTTGKDLGRVMKNMTAGQHGKTLQVLGAFTRYLSKMSTMFNPEFVITNFERDLQTAMINLSGEQSAKMAKNVLKSVPSSIRGIHNALRGDKSHEMAKWYKRFREAGGGISFMDLRGVEHIQKDIETALKGDRNKARVAARKLGDLIGDYNSMFENAARLSAFKVAVESGMSEAKAASIAKNLTVNFNRKGELGPAMNALYMFFNAGMQGSARIFGALKSKRTRQIVGTIMLAAWGLAEMNRYMAGDDEDDVNKWDKVNPYLKHTNIILMRPDGAPIKVKLPYGYNVFVAMGYAMSDIFHWMQGDGGKNPMEAGKDLTIAAMNAFNPLGGDNGPLQMLSPTVTDPLVDIAVNENFMGNPIVPEQPPWGPKKPESELYFRSVSPLSKSITQAVNELTGGNKWEPGLVSVSPEILDHMYDFIGGGALRSARDMVMLPAELSKEKPSIRRIPFLRQVFSDPDTRFDINAFYDNMEQIEVASTAVKELPVKERRRYMQSHPEFRLNKMANTYRKQMSNLRKLKYAAEDRGDEKAALRMEERMKRLAMQFNKRFNEVSP